MRNRSGYLGAEIFLQILTAEKFKTYEKYFIHTDFDSHNDQFQFDTMPIL